MPNNYIKLTVILNVISRLQTGQPVFGGMFSFVSSDALIPKVKKNYVEAKQYR